MNMELAVGAEPSSRVAHQAKHAGHIVRHAAGRYLNRHHLQLELEVAAAARGMGGVAKVPHVDLSGIGKDAHDQRPLFTLEVVRCPESSADAVREAAKRCAISCMQAEDDVAGHVRARRASAGRGVCVWCRRGRC